MMVAVFEIVTISRGSLISGLLEVVDLRGGLVILRELDD